MFWLKTHNIDIVAGCCDEEQPLSCGQRRPWEASVQLTAQRSPRVNAFHFACFVIKPWLSMTNNLCPGYYICFLF